MAATIAVLFLPRPRMTTMRPLYRGLQTAAKNPAEHSRSRTSSSCWRIGSYSGLSALELHRDQPVPAIRSPHDVLVRVRASSVNPLDVVMTQGYGFGLLNLIRTVKNPESFFTRYWEKKKEEDERWELPLTLGRDFSGEVVDFGREVEGLRVGQEVWGATFASEKGSHAEYVVTSNCSISPKPSGLSHLEASAVPYAALTALSALVISGEMSDASSRRGRRILVLGASGGVGHLAVQILKAWGCQVVATCSGDAREAILCLGADEVLDYKDADFKKNLLMQKRFDLILDCSAQNDLSLISHLKPWSNSKYVTLTSPLLRNTNSSRGVLFGAAVSANELLSLNMKAFSSNGSTFRWAYFLPSSVMAAEGGLKTLARMVENGELKPIVHKVFPYSNLPKAFEEVKKGFLRGKIVIDHSQ